LLNKLDCDNQIDRSNQAMYEEDWYLIGDILPDHSGFYIVSDGVKTRTAYYSRSKLEFLTSDDAIWIKYWREKNQPPSN